MHLHGVYISIMLLIVHVQFQDEGALHVAVQNNHIEVVDLLLASSAVINKRNKVWQMHVCVNTQESAYIVKISLYDCMAAYIDKLLGRA